MERFRAVPKQEWREFFDRISDAITGKRAEIEVASLDLGDQVVAEWITLLGITYDSADDLLDVTLAGITHLIRSPREILVEERAAGIATVAVTTSDGEKQVIRLKDSLMLPATSTSRVP